MVKPEFFGSESLGKVSIPARLLFIGLWVFGDDYGNIKAQYKRIRNSVFPDTDITEKEIVVMLSELEEVGCIDVYESNDDGLVINIPHFTDYQTVNNPSKPVIKSLGKRVKHAFHIILEKEYCSRTTVVLSDGCSTVENSTVLQYYGTTNAKEVSKEESLYNSSIVGRREAGCGKPAASLSDIRLNEPTQLNVFFKKLIPFRSGEGVS